MLIAKIKVDRRGRVQLPACFVKANDWDESGCILLKNHTHKDKVVLEYVRFDGNGETRSDKLRDELSDQHRPMPKEIDLSKEVTLNDIIEAVRP